MMGKEDDPDPDPYRVVKAPKILANLVAAVAGAVYIDVNYNVQRLWEVCCVSFTRFVFLSLDLCFCFFHRFVFLSLDSQFILKR